MIKKICIHLLIGATIFGVGLILHNVGRINSSIYIVYGGILYTVLSVCFVIVQAIIASRTNPPKPIIIDEKSPLESKPNNKNPKMSKSKINLKGLKMFNALQNKIFFLGSAALLLLYVFPPWQASNANGNSKAIGHHIIFWGPNDFLYTSLDISRLIVEMIAVCLVFGAALFFTRSEES